MIAVPQKQQIQLQPSPILFSLRGTYAWSCELHWNFLRTCLLREPRIDSTEDERALDEWFWKSTGSLKQIIYTCIYVWLYNPNTNLLNNFCYLVLRIRWLDAINAHFL